MAKIRILVTALGCIFVSLQPSLTSSFQVPTTKQSLLAVFSWKLAASDFDYEGTEQKIKRGRPRPIRVSSSAAKQAEQNRKEAQARHQQALQDPTLLTNVKFQERNDIHPATKRALVEVMGLQAMTEIQSQTYAEGKYSITGTVLVRKCNRH